MPSRIAGGMRRQAVLGCEKKKGGQERKDKDMGIGREALLWVIRWSRCSRNDALFTTCTSTKQATACYGI